MNQDTVKAILLQIEETDLEFSVVFTGKTSKKVNGLYKSDTHEIILHNKNFSVDNELLYTAIHEYTHHLLCEQDGGVHSSRVHTQRFWSFFHRLLQKAEEKGLYKITLEESPELLELTDTIRTTIMTEDGKLMKELGRLLGKARTLCKQAGIRYEDYIDRVLCLPRASASTIEKIHAFDIKPELGYEAMKVVANISNQDKRNAAEALFLRQNSPACVRDSIKTKQPEEDPRRRLEKEKRRIERTIASLQERLAELEDTLAHIPVSPFIFCLLFFAHLFFPLTAEKPDTTGDSLIQLPAVPAIPDIPSISDGNSLQPPAPPRITPPVFQRFNQNTPASSGKKNTTTQNSLKQSKPLNGLNAAKLSAITQDSNTFTFLDNLLGQSSTLEIGANETILTKILTELETLQAKIDKGEVSTDSTKDSAGMDIGATTTAPPVAAETETLQRAANKPVTKPPAAELLRLRINGREIKDDIVHTICSAASEDGTFLYGLDRRFIANGAVFNETVYFLCRNIDTDLYEISMELRQAPVNPNSFLHKLYELTPFSIRRTSDLIFWYYKAAVIEIELIFKLAV